MLKVNPNANFAENGKPRDDSRPDDVNTTPANAQSADAEFLLSLARGFERGGFDGDDVARFYGTPNDAKNGLSAILAEV